jgi:serine phosphatase RsbU (regulator of sigma subunit)
MKKLMVALLATSTMAFAAPALAHEHPAETYAQADDWSNGGDSYAEFNQEYRHIWQGIQHGLSDGSYTPSQARQFFRAMQQIRARADWMQRQGYYDPRDIQVRLERLHDDMHEAHEAGHERVERYGYGDNSGYYSYRR